jgi:hypothetical protein
MSYWQESGCWGEGRVISIKAFDFKQGTREGGDLPPCFSKYGYFFSCTKYAPVISLYMYVLCELDKKSRLSV